MIHFKTAILFIMCALIVSISVNAQTPPNSVYIILEGTSRRAIASLIQKDKLPNLKKIYTSGTFRSLDNPDQRIEYQTSYWPLLTGQKWQATSDTQWVTQSNFWLTPILNTYPKMKGYIFISKNKNPDVKNNQGIEHWLKKLKKSYGFNSKIFVQFLNAPDQQEPEYTIIKKMEKLEGPFAIMVNFSDVDDMGHRYREGSQRYSKELKRLDTIIGQMITQLKKQGDWKNTIWLITTNYGFDVKSQLYKTNQKSWAISNKKILRRGTNYDIIPTLYDAYGIPLDPRMLGKSLYRKDSSIIEE